MENLGLIFCGYGAVCKTLIALIEREENWLFQLPVVIIECTDSPKSNILYNIFGKWNNIDNNIYISDDSRAFWIHKKIQRKNYKALFDKAVQLQNSNGGIMIELAYRLETFDLINWCLKNNFMYLNTAIDKWEFDHTKSIGELKDRITKNIHESANNTILLNHGMNPGLISHMVKDLLAKINDVKHEPHTNYSKLAQKIGLRVIQISERDTQISKSVKTTKSMYVNTWSVVGLLDELFDPVQITWGTHEKELPYDYDRMYDGQVILKSTADKVKTKSYEPRGGVLQGNAIPHAETYSLKNLLRDKYYCPTIYYSYDVCEDAKRIIKFGESNLNDDGLPKSTHVLSSKEIESGYDSVGCLFLCEDGSTYWMGTILDNESAKKLSLEVNATTIQVGISLLSSIIWMINHPYEGLIEPENVDTDFILGYSEKWLGDFVCLKTNYKIKKEDLYWKPSI